MLRGKLLVAVPGIHEVTFDRTVILLLEHGDEGAVGVVVNRPAALEVDEALPGWRAAAAEPAVVFLGGPVGQGGALCLGRLAGGAPAGWNPVVGAVGVVDLSLDAADLGGVVDLLRVFSGYAGWSPGQLEGEIEAGAWVVCPAEPGDALSAEPGRLWRQVLRRQPGSLAWLANFPDHPALN